MAKNFVANFVDRRFGENMDCAMGRNDFIVVNKQPRICREKVCGQERK